MKVENILFEAKLLKRKITERHETFFVLLPNLHCRLKHCNFKYYLTLEDYTKLGVPPDKLPFFPPKIPYLWPFK